MGIVKEAADAATRTGLAWRRSGLAFVVFGMAMARGIGRVGIPAHRFAGVVVMVLGAGLAVADAVWVSRRTAGLGGIPTPLTAHAVATISLVTVFVGVACFVIALAV